MTATYETDDDEVGFADKVVNRTILAASIILPLAYAWLQVTEGDIQTFVRDENAAIFFKFALVLYFASWIAGARFDLRQQRRVYAVGPSKKQVVTSGLGLMCLLIVIFFVMCALQTDGRFFLFLALFWTTDLVGWIYMVRRVLARPAAESRAVFEKKADWFKLERFELVWDHIGGRWRAVRLAVGYLSIGVLALLLFTPLAEVFRRALVARFALQIRSTELVLTLCILLHVLGVEGWMWHRRLELLYGVRLLERTAARYELKPRSAADPPAPKHRSRRARRAT